jgi:hypothetical protein
MQRGISNSSRDQGPRGRVEPFPSDSSYTRSKWVDETSWNGQYR